jgi:hypothetical protein
MACPRARASSGLAVLGIGALALLLTARSARTAELVDLFELEGNIVDEAPPTPDWAGVFRVDVAPNGQVLGPVMPLPADGVAAGFRRDDLAIAGLDKTDCSVFARGNKNGDPISSWEFKAGSVPPKDDLSNVMAFLRDDGTGSLELYLALERYAENGDSHVDFEINQDPIGLAIDAPGVSCPGDGHFTGQRRLNDLLVAVDFERGGDIGLVRIYRYLDATDLELLVEQSGGPAGPFCNAATSSGNLQIPAGTICLVNNADVIDGGPWANFNRSDSRGPVEQLPRNAFTELGIRLGDLPGALGTSRCIHSINVKTRSSQSITSELKDFSLVTFNTCSNIAGMKREVADDGSCETPVGPLANWEIRLLDDSGLLVTHDGDGNPLSNPACTGPDGEYAFLGLPNGKEYTVCEVVPDRRTGAAAENFDWLACAPGDGAPGSSVPAPACSGQNGGEEFCHPAITLEADVSGIDFQNLRQVITCELEAVAFCDVNGNGFLDPPDDASLDGFCLCVTRLVGGTPDPSTRQCGVTSGGAFRTMQQTGYSYRVEEDVTGAACSSANRSDVWTVTTQPQDVFLDPDSAGPCAAAMGNASQPSIVCPAGVTFECDAVGDFGDATATNDCGDPTISVVDEEQPGTCVLQRTISRTHTATTGAGLTAECTQTVQVNDTTPPMITCPSDRSFECDGIGEFGVPIVVDNCDPHPMVSFVETVTENDCTQTAAGGAAGISPPPKLILTRDYTAADGATTAAAGDDTCSNVSTCTQTILILDTTPPVIECPPDLTFECDDIGDFGAATATDTCDEVTISDPVVVQIPGECPGESTIYRTFTATDACGLTDSCTQTIVIQDTTAPTLICPPDLTVECGEDVDYGTPIITDNCDPDPQVTVSITEIPGDCTQNASGSAAGISPPPKLFLVIEYRSGEASAAAGGLCGNVATCTQIVEIIDTEPPSIVACPADAVVNCDQPFEFSIPTQDTCEGSLDVNCVFMDDAEPDRFTAEPTTTHAYSLTLTGTTIVSVMCSATDECDNTSPACAFDVSAVCNTEACSPGFWRNNLDSWCLTPFNPTKGYCSATGATSFLSAFGLAACPHAPSDSAIRADAGLSLFQAVSSSGGSNQTLFHGSAALLSSFAVEFPAGTDAVTSVMRDACTGSTDFDGQPVSWDRAFSIFKAWNAAEADGGCPLAGSFNTRTDLHRASGTVRSR